MILREYERFVVECELVIDMYPKGAPFIELDRSIPHLMNYINSGHAIYKMLNGRVSIRAKQAVNNGDSISILFIYNDKDGADPSFGNEHTGSVRTEKKKDGEGIAVSAHLIIKKKPVNDRFTQNYFALLEEVPSLNRRNISSALTHFLKEATDFECESPKTGKLIHPRQLVSLDACASHTLDELMKTGKLRGFVAIQNAVNERLDEDGEVPIMVKERTMKMSVASVMGQKALNAIAQVRDKVLGQEYSRLRISYTDSNKRNKSLDLDVRADDALSKGYSKVVKFDFPDAISQCEEEIHQALHNKMLAYLVSESGCTEDDN